MGVRKIGMSAVKNVVRVPTRKTIGCNSIMVESLLERRFVIAFEFDDRVINYEPQPETFTVEASSGTTFRYTPDFLVETDRQGDNALFIEVKPYSRLRNPRIATRLEAVRSYLSNKGSKFLICTDQHLGSAAKCRNQDYFFPRLIRPAVNPEEYSEMIEIADGSTTAKCLASQIAGPSSVEVIMTLIAHGKLQIDWDLPFLFNSSPIWAVEIANEI